jgi:hypothetical protein
VSRFGATKRAAGFRRVNVAMGWLAGAAVMLVGVFGFTAARETASAKASTAPAPPASTGDTTATAPPLAPEAPSSDPGYQSYQNDQGFQNDPGYQTPDTLPQRSYREPVASSGGS